MTLYTLFRRWLPLAISVELMMLEGTALQGATSRLPDATIQLAAIGVTLVLSLLIESPVIMLLATAIALVRDEASFRALRWFVIHLNVASTILTALIAFTPAFGFIVGVLMQQPEPIVRAAQPAMQIMLLWTAAIGWRRFYQGTLIKYNKTQSVTIGTVARLGAAIATAYFLTTYGKMSGAEVGAWVLMVGVLVEAFVTTLLATPVLRKYIIGTIDTNQPPLTQWQIWKFHTPLAMTMLITLCIGPVTSAALARLPNSTEALAAWHVTYTILLILRGWGFAVQEITVAHAKTPENRHTLYRFAWWVGIATAGLTGLVASTPLLRLYFDYVLDLPPPLHPLVIIGTLSSIAIPLLTSVGCWARGVLVAHGKTGQVYQGMGINLITHSLFLVVGVALKLPGMQLAAISYTIASLLEYLYLIYMVKQKCAHTSV